MQQQQGPTDTSVAYKSGVTGTVGMQRLAQPGKRYYASKRQRTITSPALASNR